MKLTEEKAKGGRKRTHLVKVYLSDGEYEKLCRDAATFKRDDTRTREHGRPRRGDQ